MKKLWTYIDEKPWSEKTKYRAIILIVSFISGTAGFFIWLMIRTWALSTWDWMLCFILWPVIISWPAVFLYSCRNRFHNKNRYEHGHIQNTLMNTGKIKYSAKNQKEMI